MNNVPPVIQNWNKGKSLIVQTLFWIPVFLAIFFSKEISEFVSMVKDNPDWLPFSLTFIIIIVRISWTMSRKRK